MRSKAAILVEPSAPLVIDKVDFPDPDHDFSTFVRWYQRGQLNLDDLVTQRYTLDQINEAVADLTAGRIHGRSSFMYN